MKTRVLFAAALSVVLLGVHAEAQSLATKRHIEKANKETIPAALKTIEETIGAKPSLEVDAASFGEDEDAWENFSGICYRITVAFEFAGKDEAAKAALAKKIKKIVVRKVAKDAKDEAAVKDGVLTVRTTATNAAIPTLHLPVQEALEKAF